jgi:probable HAF family extracellular repeat protein
MNQWGTVVGMAETSTSELHAFRWSREVMTDLGTLGSNLSRARAINDVGVAVGQSVTAAGAFHAFVAHW